MSYIFLFKENKNIYNRWFFDNKIVPVIGMIECHCHHNYSLSYCLCFENTGESNSLARMK